MVTEMLDPGARRALDGTRFADLRWHDEIDSTNREILQLARDGAPEGVVVGADHQTAGRGRLGRTWESPPGSSLLVSVLLRPTLSPDHVHMASMAVGVAASDACAELAGFRPTLKWPNDLVVEADEVAETSAGRATGKLGGILGETLLSGDTVDAVGVGLGLNVRWPAGASRPSGAVSVEEVAGQVVEREPLLVLFLRRLDEHYGALLEHGGWRGTLMNYRRLCSTLGRHVRVELATESFRGRAMDVTGEGHLVVHADDGSIRRVAAGDVVHVRDR